MSVVFVPLDVTGDGPTMSLGIGLISCMPLEVAPSVELGRRFECSTELLADLHSQHGNSHEVWNVQRLESWRIGMRGVG